MSEFGVSTCIFSIVLKQHIMSYIEKNLNIPDTVSDDFLRNYCVRQQQYICNFN